jgi:hypothetical protein
MYGFRRLIADIDRGREYWREAETTGVFGCVLDWIIGEGFNDFFERYDDWSWDSAHDFRQRYMTRAIDMIGRRRGF